MADDKYKTEGSEDGIYTPSYKTNLTGRQNPVLGAIRDTVLETTASAIDLMAMPYAYGRDYGASSGNKKLEIAGQLGQQFASEGKDWVRSGKTDFGRQEDKNGGANSTWLENAATALPSALPQIAAASLTGAAAPAAWAAMAHGQQSQQFEEELFKMPRDKLEKTSGYQKYKDQGMEHDDIMRAMHKEMRNDPEAWLPNVGLNFLTAGIVTQLSGKIGSRTIAKTMTDRILKNALIEMPEAGLGGAATGAAQSFSRQYGQKKVGLRDEYDFGEMRDEAIKMGTTLGTFGAAGVAIRSVRGPGKEASSTGKTTGDLLEDAKNKPVTSPIGSDLNAVAVDNLSGGKEDPATATKHPGEPTPTPGGEAAPVKPPVAPVAGAIDPTVTPAGKEAPVAPVDPRVVAPTGEAAPAFRDLAVVQEELNNAIHEARSLDAALPEQRATPEWQAAHAEVMAKLDRLDTERERIEGATKPGEPSAEAVQAHVDITAPPEAITTDLPGGGSETVRTLPGGGRASSGEGGTARAPTGEAAPAKMTLDDLKARAQELGRTGGTIDAMNAAIKEYTTQHGLKKLPEHTEVTQAWSAGKAEAKAEAATKRGADLETTRQTKAAAKAAEAEAKAAAKLAKTEAAAEKRRVDAEEKAAKRTARTEKSQRAKAQAQAKGFAGLAETKQSEADAAERARLQEEAKAAAQKKIDEREGNKPVPVELDDIAALVDEASKPTVEASAGVGPAGKTALAKVNKGKGEGTARTPRKTMTAEEAEAAANALLDAPAKGKGKGKGVKKPPRPGAAKPKSNKERVEAHATKNPITRFVVEENPSAGKFGPKAVIVDTEGLKPSRPINSMERAKEEADLLNTQETRTQAERAIMEEDRAEREAKRQGIAPTVTPAGKPDAPTAAPVVSKLVRKVDVDKAEADKAEAKRLQDEAQETERKRLAENEKAKERQRAKRQVDQDIRERTAQTIVEEHKQRSHNQAGDINALEASMESKEPADAVPEMLLLSNTAKELANAYDAALLRLRGGAEDHETFNSGRGKGGEARGGKGDYHSFLIYLREYARKIEDLIAKKDFVEAKDRTDKYVKALKMVQKGDIKDFSAAIKEMNDALSMETRSHTVGGERVEGAMLRKAQEEHADIISAIDDMIDEHGATLPPMEQLKGPDGKPLLDKDGRVQFQPSRAERHGSSKETDTREYNTKDDQPAPIKWERVDNILDKMRKWMDRNGYDFVPPSVVHKIIKFAGETVERTTFGKLMENHRPDNPLMAALFDFVKEHAADIPVQIWSPEAMTALDILDSARQPEGSPPSQTRAFYNGIAGFGAFRSDTLVGRTIFHEALHAMTLRALEGSDRLKYLVNKLRDIVDKRYANDPRYKDTYAYEALTKRDAHEFISEYYTRPEAFDMVNDLQLTRAEIAELQDAGFESSTIPKDDRGIVRRVIDAVLETLGFKEPKTVGGYEFASDLLANIMNKEFEFRDRDVALGIPDIGRIYDWADLKNLALQDPVRGKAAWAAMKKGDHGTAAENLIRMADKMDATTADKSIEYLNRVNEHYYGRQRDVAVTRMSNPEEIHTGVIDFIEQRLGHRAADWAWQIDNKFGTPLRKFVQGMAYTNDIGNTLEQAFQDILQPLKRAWSRRENFSQKYMDTSGANQLIDDIAKARNAIADRHNPNSLWSKFENLMIRESYGRARADVELGRDENAHINTGDLKDRQAVADWVANRAVLEEIKARNPELIALRNRIFDFTKKEMAERNKVAVRDMLLEFKAAGRGDEIALSALTKDVLKQNDKMTVEERAALDRVLKVGKESDVYKNILAERAWMKKTHGEASKTYQDYLKKSVVREARALKPAGELYEKYKATRDDVRAIVDISTHNGPHVPFTRHGNHAVYAEYQVTPDKGVEYKEVGEKALDDTHTSFDFKKRPDAEHFIDHTLSHPDIQISLRDATEVVYDTRTGEQAAVWTVVKPDGTATTFEGREAANAAMETGDKISKKNLTPKDIEQMKEDGQPTAHLETWQRITFNPKEFTTFESERAAHNYRARLAQDTGLENFKLKVSNVESPHDMIGRANTAYTSAEMKQWINRQEAMPEYQRMDPDEKAAWARKLKIEAARVTATAGRRTMNMPRDFAKGASTDLLKGIIGYAGNNARAIADLTYRAEIDDSLRDVEKYNEHFRNQSGFNARRLEGETDAAYKARRDAGSVASGHRARDEALREIKDRLFAPPKMEGSWAQGIKRALQVSMISHLADTGYLIVNAIEPWVFGASVSAGRHGWAETYKQMGIATKLIDPWGLAKAAGEDIAAAAKGQYGPNNYEKLLLTAVTGDRNVKGDGAFLSRMLTHMFDRGLAARDVGMEVERVHDPSSNIAARALDSVDNVFRGFNTGVETFNRALLAVSNARLEYERAIKDGLSPEKAELQAIRYAEDSIFKSAGDYGAWNNPRYFANPVLKLALQFKKYPLRIFSVYADAVLGTWRGQPEKQKQLAYMLLAQAVAAGGMGLPLASFGAGITNAAYLLGITDNNWDDFQFALRKQLTKYTGVAGAEMVLHGALRFTGADFTQKMSQNSFIFQGSPQDRDPKKLITTLALTGLGAPGHMAETGVRGYQNLREGISDYTSGARSQGTSKAMQGAGEIVQIKVLANIMKSMGMMFGDSPRGLPKDQSSTTAQAFITGLGFTPTSVANKTEAKRVTTRERKKESDVHNRWVNRWRDAKNSSEQAAIKRQIDSYNETLDNPSLRITMEDLWKARNRKQADAKRDERKLGVPLSGRQKAFSDVGGYFRID